MYRIYIEPALDNSEYTPTCPNCNIIFDKERPLEIHGLVSYSRPTFPIFNKDGEIEDWDWEGESETYYECEYEHAMQCSECGHTIKDLMDDVAHGRIAPALCKLVGCKNEKRYPSGYCGIHDLLHSEG